MFVGMRIVLTRVTSQLSTICGFCADLRHGFRQSGVFGHPLCEAIMLQGDGGAGDAAEAAAELPVPAVQDDWLLPLPAIHHVVEGSRILDA